MLDILKQDNLFFKVFYYLNYRLKESTDWTVAKIKAGALRKFIDKRLGPGKG